MRNKKQSTITPGGPREKAQTHAVEPGQAVSNVGGNAVIVNAPPRVPAGHILTPGGYRNASRVHFLEEGHVLDATGGRLRKIGPGGKTVADFGPLATGATGTGRVPLRRAAAGGNLPAPGGWVAYTQWTNNTGTPVSSFRTTWIVPPEPETTNGQTIFLFNGLQDTPVSVILQPVLQWGESSAGSGRHWAVASWAVFTNGDAFFSKLVRVKPGDTLIGVMKLASQIGGVFTYLCEFEGIAKTALPFMTVNELDWCAETLETYDITTCSDHPDTPLTRFRNISIWTGSTRPALAWAPVNAETACGQSARVISNSASDGEVDITYRRIVSESRWPSIGGVFPDGAPVAAVTRSDNNIDLFICDSDGRVYTAWWRKGDGWSSADDGRWSSIGGTLPASVPVTAITRSNNDIDLYATGNDGRVYTAWWRDGDGWSSADDGRWSSIGGALPAGAPVAAVSRSRNDIDLYATGNDGRVYTSWWRDGDGWSSADDGRWSSIGGAFPRDARVTAITRSRNDIDLYATGSDGRVYTSWWRDGDGWSSADDGRWSSIGGAFPDGAPVAAVTRSDKNIDLFATGNDGRVYTAWWRDGAGWSSADDGRWSSIGGVFPPGAAVTAITRSNNDIDLYATGNDGRVYTAWWRDGAGWSSADDGRWSPLGAALPAGAPVTAITRSRKDIDLYATGDDGHVGTTWWRDGDGWTV